jgi:RNA polymerase sigma-70 factor (ECF subfamily)
LHPIAVKTLESDISIIERILAGDKAGYRDLANRHKDYAFTVAYKIVGTREDAEEVAQDAFIQAFQALPQFNKESKFTTWFYRIVFNTALMFKRKIAYKPTILRLLNRRKQLRRILQME